MRDGYQKAVDKGINLDIFAANTAFRPIRLEKDAIGQASRIETAYKDPSLDPETKSNKQLSTPAAWRYPPTSWPESELIGAMYADHDKQSYPMVVSDASNWIFDHSGLKNNQSIPGLVGYESDKLTSTFPSPKGVAVLTSSPIKDVKGHDGISNSTVYKKGSGGTVFNAGTMQWSWALDNFGGMNLVNPGIQQATKNILSR